jgi:hypothetical protein
MEKLTGDQIIVLRLPKTGDWYTEDWYHYHRTSDSATWREGDAFRQSRRGLDFLAEGFTPAEIRRANVIARKRGRGFATKIVRGGEDHVIEATSCGYRKYTTGEYVCAKYRACFGWKNTYYQAAECVVEIAI